ncbi:MAG: c-type cytochrome domain-containing protein [Bacteroidota bacterium]
MRKTVALSVVALTVTVVLCACGGKNVSFSQEVAPIIKKHCVTCHFPGNEFNESRLAMNTYESLMQGGVHGSPVVPGDADSSLMIKKLGLNPPFGRQMPLMSKEKLSDDEVALIAKWINQGANNN